MKSLGRIVGFALFSVHVTLMALLLLSAFSDRISPEKSVFFSFLGMGFPFLILPNLFFVVWWFLFMQWKKMLAGIVSLLLCWGAINAYFPLNARTRDLPEDCIKILTYNVMGFHHSSAHSEKHPNPVLQYIIDCKADIVCIQEHRSYQNSRHLSPDDLKKALKMYPYSHFYRIETADPSLGIYGMSVYSKFPIKSAEKIKFNSTYNGAFKVELDIRGKKVTLINCHLETNNLSDEDRQQYDNMVKDFNSKNIDAMADRTFRKLKPAFKARAAQADKVAEVVGNDTNPYVIVCGDFNDTPISYARQRIKGNLVDAFAETGRGPGITYNRNHFYFRIDYILHSRNIKSYNCSVGKLKDSDHYPVCAWLKLD